MDKVLEVGKLIVHARRCAVQAAARECVEIADAENASGRGGRTIREKFGLTTTNSAQDKL